MSKEQGTVKFFDSAKGFGFIRRKDAPHIFVHQSQILMDGFRSLTEGQEVEFDVTENSKGFEAVNVVPLQKGERDEWVGAQDFVEEEKCLEL
jgi:CspA family cold shock protein